MMGRGKDTGIDELRTSWVSLILTFDLSKLTNSMRDSFRQLFHSNRILAAGNNGRMGPMYHTHSLPKLCCSTVYLLSAKLRCIYKTRVSQRNC